MAYEDLIPQKAESSGYGDLVPEKKGKEPGFFEKLLGTFAPETTARYQAATDIEAQKAAVRGATMPYRKAAAATGQLIPGLSPSASQYARQLEAETKRMEETRPEAFGFGQVAGLAPLSFIPGRFAPSMVPARQAPTAFGQALEFGRSIGGTALKAAPYGAAVSTLTQPVYEAQDLADVLKAKPGQAAGGAALSAALGGALATVPAAFQGGSAFAEAVRRATGRPVREAREAATTEARRIGGEALTEAQQRGQIAGKAEERLAGRAELTTRGMPGVRTEELLGRATTVPRTSAEVGDYIRKQASQFRNSIKTQRNNTANTLMTAARDEAAQKEQAGELIQQTPKFQNVIRFIDQQLEFTSDPTTRAPLETLKRALTQVEKRALDEGERRVLALRTNRPLEQIPETEGVPTPFRGVEILRRKLGDAAFGDVEEGYKAIGQDNARKLYGLVSEAMQDYAPSFNKFLSEYKRLSEPLDVFNTKVGRALVQEAKDAGGYMATDAASIPNTVFGSRDKVKELIDAFGGNREPVIAAARQYFAGQLQGKNAEQALKYLRSDKVRQVVDELGIGKDLTTRMVAPARALEARASQAGQLRQVSEKQAQELQQKVDDLVSAGENDVVNKAQSLSDYIRRNGLTDRVQVDQLNKLINEYETAKDKQASARRLIVALTGLLGAGYFTRQTVSGSAIGE